MHEQHHRGTPSSLPHDGSVWSSERRLYWPLWGYMVVITAFAGVFAMGWIEIPAWLAGVLS
jgi:hypothetical protein